MTNTDKSYKRHLLEKVKELKMVEPTAVFTPFDGKVQILLFGRPHDWSLRVHDGEQQPRPDTLNRVMTVRSDYKINEIYAPMPATFNGVVCDPSDLNKPVNETFTAIRRGCDADGVVIRKRNDAIFIGSADCVTIVAYGINREGKSILIPAHAGRDCLVDRGALDRKTPRTHESVVFAIMEKMKTNGVQPANIRVFLTCGIGPDALKHPYDHVTWGTKNLAMIEYLIAKWGMACIPEPDKGTISLTEIIRAQFNKAGVPSHNIGGDNCETYSTMNNDGEHFWWSHRRAIDLKQGPKEELKRNGVFVILRA